MINEIPVITTEEKDRMFIVSYSLKNGFGQCGIKTTGGYVNREYVTKYANKSFPGAGSVIILNIIEVSLKEYEQFTEPLDKKVK